MHSRPRKQRIEGARLRARVIDRTQRTQARLLKMGLGVSAVTIVLYRLLDCGFRKEMIGANCKIGDLVDSVY